MNLYVVVEIIEGLRPHVIGHPTDMDTAIDCALELRSRSQHKYRIALISWID